MERVKIKGYENYEVSKSGIIYFLGSIGISRFGGKRVNKPKIIKQSADPNGYKKCTLFDGKRGKQFLVHRIIGIAFIPNPLNKPQINHKDGNQSNNEINNLEWVTAKENSEHAIKTGLKDISAERNGNVKLTWNKVNSIRKEYKPYKITRASLAKKYKVQESMIGYILNGTNWKQ